MWEALDAGGEYTDVDEEVDSILLAGFWSGAAPCDAGVEDGSTAAVEASEEGSDGALDAEELGSILTEDS